MKLREIPYLAFQINRISLVNYDIQITLFQSLPCLLADIMENSFKMPNSVSVFIVLLEETEQRQKSLILEKEEKKILAVKMSRH